MMPALQKFLLAGAYLVACANARYYLGGSNLAPAAPMAVLGSGRRNHQQVRRIAHRHGNAAIIDTLTLRGGGNLIEENPEYISDGDDTSSSESDDDNDELDESASDDDATPSTSNSKRRRHHLYPKVLLVSKSSKQNSSDRRAKSKSHNKRVRNFIKTNQVKLYILLAIIAFREDIGDLALRIIPTQLDPVTGKRKTAIRWSTDVLKLILVGVIVRRFFLPSRGGGSIRSIATPHSDSGNGEEGHNNNATQPVEPSSKRIKIPILPLLLLLLLIPMVHRHVGNLSLILMPIILQSLSGNLDPDSPLSRLFLMLRRGDSTDVATRMAYLPPLEQHYTFEQLNERYYRDCGAWRKAFPTNPMVAAAPPRASGREAAGSGGDSMTSLISVLRNAQKPSSSSSSPPSQTISYPNKYNNGTVIVLDMTSLDMKASKMDSVRDQISFLIHLVQTELAPSNPSQQAEANMGQSSGADVVIGSSNITSTNASSTNPEMETPIECKSSQQSSSSSPPPTVEVIVLLESPGGGVSQYGLAASHLHRLRSTPNVLLTVCIDEMAASGGYMMACMSSHNQLYCAPFAMVGSIGVIGQALNVQKTLENYGVQPYVFRGGKMKNPVGLVGEVTKEGVAAMQESVERIHDAFRGHVAGARGKAFIKASNAMLLSNDDDDDNEAISKEMGNSFELGGGCSGIQSSPTPTTNSASVAHVMDKVATGDVFLGTQALELGLVDRLITSDEYIAERIRQGARVLKLIQYHKRTPGLSGLLIPPSHPHRSRHQFSLANLLKKVVFRTASSLSAWAEDGLTTAGTSASSLTFSATAEGGGVV